MQLASVLSRTPPRRQRSFSGRRSVGAFRYERARASQRDTSPERERERNPTPPLLLLLRLFLRLPFERSDRSRHACIISEEIERSALLAGNVHQNADRR